MSAIKEYYRPEDWKSAAEILGRPGVKTAPILVSTKPSPVEKWDMETAVDLSRLGLDYIKEDEQGIHIGALTTVQTLVDTPIFSTKFNGIFHLAAKHAATGGLRNVATMAGVLNDLSGSGEIALTLLASDAVVYIRKDQSIRTQPIAGFLAEGKQNLTAGEVLAEIRIPFSDGVFALERVARTPADQEIVAVVVFLLLSGSQITKARVAISGASPQPMRFLAVEQALEKQEFSSSLVEKAAEIATREAKPIGDFRGSAEYRAAMAGTLTRRALLKAWNLKAG